MNNVFKLSIIAALCSITALYSAKQHPTLAIHREVSVIRDNVRLDTIKPHEATWFKSEHNGKRRLGGFYLDLNADTCLKVGDIVKIDQFSYGCKVDSIELTNDCITVMVTPAYLEQKQQHVRSWITTHKGT